MYRMITRLRLEKPDGGGEADDTCSEDDDGAGIGMGMGMGTGMGMGHG
jgi:hypothetical protein